MTADDSLNQSHDESSQEMPNDSILEDAPTDAKVKNCFDTFEILIFMRWKNYDVTSGTQLYYDRIRLRYLKHSDLNDWCLIKLLLLKLKKFNNVDIPDFNAIYVLSIA